MILEKDGAADALSGDAQVQGPGEHASMDLTYPLAVGETEFENISERMASTRKRGRMQKRDVCCGADWWWAQDSPRLFC